MKYALLFRENIDPILVSADEVKAGKYNRNGDFIDPEYEFKVQFVSGAKNNGGPYFRMYYSYEEYKRLSPERASRYEIVANMRKYDESEWHKKWKKNVSGFCEIEKCLKNESKKKWKFADAYYEKANTCIEFQHSYISFDFEERNEFYASLSIDTIWLYDLSSADIRRDEQGNIEILEDNSKGFFRISENPDNLKKQRVYIQVKHGMIYSVNELFRRDSSTEQLSTIRYFRPLEEYTEEEFVEAIRLNKLTNQTSVCGEVKDDNPEVSAHNDKQQETYNELKTLNELWNINYKSMKVKNIEKDDFRLVNCDQNGEMYRDYKNGCIKFKYVDNKYNNLPVKDRKEYWISREDEERSIWLLISHN